MLLATKIFKISYYLIIVKYLIIVMTYYYNLPKRKNVIDKSQIVRIEEENELKFVCQEKSFVNKLLLDMKNTKVNDESTICLNFIESELKLETIDAS